MCPGGSYNSYHFALLHWFFYFTFGLDADFFRSNDASESFRSDSGLFADVIRLYFVNQ